jgi:type I restriction enzyme, S subunit
MGTEVRAQLLDLLGQAGFSPLPCDWDAVVLGDLLAEDRGISVGVMYPGEHDPAGVPLIKAGDLSGHRINPHPDFRISPAVHKEYRRTELEGGELLMTLVGNVGSCAIAKAAMRGWNAARAIAVMRFRNSDDGLYVRCCLQSRQIQHLMDTWSNTTVQQTLNLKEIKQLPIPWPSNAIRSRIAHILGTLDDKIELNRRMNETLEAMARAVFKSWFVDFDPVRAKAAGRAPSGMDAETAKLFPNEFVSSEVGEIPKGWTVVPLGDLLAADRGISVGVMYPGDHDPSGVPLIKAGDLTAHTINLHPQFRISPAVHHQYRRTELEGGELLMTLVGNVGSCAIASPELRGWNAARAIAVMRLRDPSDGLYVRCCLQSQHIQHLMDVWSNTTVQQTLNLKEIKQIPLVWPSHAIRTRITHILGALNDKVELNRRINASLAQIRDTLLPRLLSGELSVKQAEAFVERV